jgi:hypothetical protein
MTVIVPRKTKPTLEPRASGFATSSSAQKRFSVPNGTGYSMRRRSCVVADLEPDSLAQHGFEPEAAENTRVKVSPHC